MVLRVSSSVAPVPWIAATYFWVNVAGGGRPAHHVLGAVGDDAAGGLPEIRDRPAGANDLGREFRHQGDDFHDAHGLFSLCFGDEQ